MIRLVLPCVVAVFLAGCATTVPDSWIAPEAIRMPGRISIRLPAAEIGNKGDLVNSLKTDSVGFREWLKPILREQVCLATRIDTIDWVDSLDVVADTAAPGWERFGLERPATRAGRGWILVVSGLRAGRALHQGKAVDGIQAESQALEMEASYLLVDRGSGRSMASGHARVASPFRSFMDRSNWEDAAAALGQRIGERLPRR